MGFGLLSVTTFKFASFFQSVAFDGSDLHSHSAVDVAAFDYVDVDVDADYSDVDVDDDDFDDVDGYELAFDWKIELI